MSDAEQRAQRKKRARRDFDDEDYEEPAQPRRVSARRQAAAEAQAAARKGVLRPAPSDKRKLAQKGIQRIDSMQFGGVRTCLLCSYGWHHNCLHFAWLTFCSLLHFSILHKVLVVSCPSLRGPEEL